MRKLDVNIVLFVAGVLMASNGLIALLFSWALEQGPVYLLIWGFVTVVGLVLTSMTWRQVLQLLMRPRQRSSSSDR